MQEKLEKYIFFLIFNHSLSNLPMRQTIVYDRITMQLKFQPTTG